jgi:hypothetical protein
MIVSAYTGPDHDKNCYKIICDEIIEYIIPISIKSAADIFQRINEWNSYPARI